MFYTLELYNTPLEWMTFQKMLIMPVIVVLYLSIIWQLPDKFFTIFFLFLVGLYHEINNVFKVRFVISEILMWMSVFTFRFVSFFIKQIIL
jgi:hypothetical protein